MLKYQFTGKVDSVSDETVNLPVKNSLGVPTGQTLPHRVTTIVVRLEKEHETVAFSGFDLPSTFQLPKEGDVWTSPCVKSIDLTKGIATCRL